MKIALPTDRPVRPCISSLTTHIYFSSQHVVVHAQISELKIRHVEKDLETQQGINTELMNDIDDARQSVKAANDEVRGNFLADSKRASDRLDQMVGERKERRERE
jgi:hypothetical protein